MASLRILDDYPPLHKYPLACLFSARCQDPATTTTQASSFLIPLNLLVLILSNCFLSHKPSLQCAIRPSPLLPSLLPPPRYPLHKTLPARRKAKVIVLFQQPGNHSSLQAQASLGQRAQEDHLEQAALQQTPQYHFPTPQRSPSLSVHFHQQPVCRRRPAAALPQRLVFNNAAQPITTPISTPATPAFCALSLMAHQPYSAAVPAIFLLSTAVTMAS